MQFRIRVYKLTVEIVAGKGGSVVSSNYTIWIDHRHNLKHYISAKIYRLLRRACNELKESFHNKRSDCFSWVNTSANNNILFEFVDWSEVLFFEIVSLYCDWLTLFTHFVYVASNR